MRTPVILIFMLCSVLGLNAQQDPLYSMYMFNHMAINPAYSGSLDQIQAIGQSRRQWLSFPGAPQTSCFALNGPLKKENMGLGFSFINDRMGVMKTNAFMASYAYQIRFNRSRLSFGLQTGVRNFSIPLSEIKLSPGNEFDNSFADNVSQWNLNFGTGAFWYGDNWYAGFSIPHIHNTLLGKQQISTVYDARLRTHYFLTGGYVIRLNPTFRLKPSVLIKNVTGAPLQIDLNANYYWLDLAGIGVSYRNGSALAALAEVQVNKNIRVGYSFDQAINGLNGYSGGSHELLVRWDFGFNKNKTVTPRYF